MKKLLMVLGVALGLTAGPLTAAEITVSAASSLTDAMRAVAADYEKRHSNAKVLLNFGASGALLQQMLKGAPVDVFASADQKTMDQAEEAGLINKAQRFNFAQNSLVLVVPIASQLSMAQLADLKQPEVLRISMGNPDTTPAGRYALRALDASGFYDSLKAKLIKTQNVRQSLDYVARGEVDTGFVFATDATVMPGRVKVAFTVPLAEPITYPIAVTRNQAAETPAGKEARRFVAFVLSDAGQAILEKYGFTRP